MDSQLDNNTQNPEQSPGEELLLAEREAILRQLAELGEDLSGSEDEDNEEDEEDNLVVEPDNDGSEDSHSSENADESSLLNAEEAEVKPEGSPDSHNPPIQIEKIVLENADDDKSLPLPEGWIVIAHTSGMPVYYHKFTRVVTHSKPYQWEGVVRDHSIPICAIPCLYREKMDAKRRQLEESSMNKEGVDETEVCPESKKKNEPPQQTETERMKPEEFQQYCARRFNFKKVTVLRHHKPSDRVQAAQERKTNVMLKKAGFDLNYDQLKKSNGEGEILLTSATGISFIDLTYIDTKKRGASKKPYLMNPMGKTSIAVLNEFIQRLVKGSLTYQIHDTRNVTCPYQATASLTIKKSQLEELAGHCKESLTVLSEIAIIEGGTEHGAGVPSDFRRFAVGRGIGCNKKTARLVAATAALSKLIPKLRVSAQHICDGIREEANKNDFETEARELFKKVNIDSQNLVEMCTRFAIPKPYALLKDAVSRSVRWNGMELLTNKELIGPGHQRSKVTLILGDMYEEAEAIGVKQATQFASQLLLKKMHPEVLTYGGFLEMYGRFEDKSKMEFAKRQHDEVVRLHDTGNLLKPNFIVLSKLAEEMKEVSLVHPPRKFLYGLAPDAAEMVKSKKSVQSQYRVDDFIPPRAVPYPQLSAPPAIPIDQMANFPMARMPTYQPFPTVISPGTQQNRNSRKRGAQDEQTHHPHGNLPPGNFPPRSHPPQGRFPPPPNRPY